MDGYLVTAGVSEIEYIQMGEYEKFNLDFLRTDIEVVTP